MRNRYIQLYDDNGFEILGSDGLFFFDQRLKPMNAFKLAETHARKMINIRKICYAKMYNYPIGRGSLVHDTVMLWDPTDATFIWEQIKVRKEAQS